MFKLLHNYLFHMLLGTKTMTNLDREGAGRGLYSQSYVFLNGYL